MACGSLSVLATSLVRWGTAADMDIAVVNMIASIVVSGIIVGAACYAATNLEVC